MMVIVCRHILARNMCRPWADAAHVLKTSCVESEGGLTKVPRALILGWNHCIRVDLSLSCPLDGTTASVHRTFPCFQLSPELARCVWGKLATLLCDLVEKECFSPFALCQLGYDCDYELENGKPMDEWQCRVSLVYSAVTWRCKLTKVQWRRLLWTPVWSQFNSTLKVNHQI